MPKYEQMENYIRKTDDDGTIWSIPLDDSNSDYIAYLEWQAAQTPETKPTK